MKKLSLQLLAVVILLTASHASFAADAVDFAASKMSSPYVWGATGPSSFDCSGLTLWAYQQVRITLPRTSQQQINASGWYRVGRTQLQRGDLVFFHTDDSNPNDISHMGIFEGGSTFINANSYWGKVVRDNIDDGYWKARFVSGTRLSSGTPNSSPTAPTGDRSLYRYYNPATGDRFYSTDFNEVGSGRWGYVYEGVGSHVYSTSGGGRVPLYRYNNPGMSLHHYTTNWSELGQGNWGYQFERIECYVYPMQASGLTALYRYCDTWTGAHFFTTNWNELGGGNSQYRYEGIQCYVYP